MNIAQEVFIDHEPSTITYEVGCHHPISLILIANLIHLLTDESIHLPILGRCAKLIRVQTQCSLAAMQAKNLFSTPWSRFLRTRGYKIQIHKSPITNHAFLYISLCFFMDLNSWNVWSQDLEGGSKEETGKATKVSDLRDWGGWQ